MLRNPLLVPDLRELIQAGEDAALRDFFQDHHPAQVAEIVEDLEAEEGDAVLLLLSGRARADVMSYLPPDRQVEFITGLPAAQAAALLHLMPHDDRADLVNRLEEDQVDGILPHLAQAEREDIRRLASYEPGTAGAAMTTDYVTLSPSQTVREALDRIRREAPDRETIEFSYVVDDQRRLLGFVSLKRIILARPTARIDEIMQHDTIVARVDDDQESAARLVDKYDLFALPVLDDADMLVGIITHDDAMDILRREQTEDLLAFGGVSPEPEDGEAETYWQARVVTGVRRRLLPLSFLFFSGILTIAVIDYFHWLDDEFDYLRFDIFIPLLIGTGGNAGSQTVGTIIRALALGEVRPQDLRGVLAREWLTGALLGSLLGCVGFVLAFVWQRDVRFAGVIGLAILGICMWANSVGAIVPLMARRIGLDPALISAPLISTFVDTTGLIIYYTLAILLLWNLGSPGR